MTGTPAERAAADYCAKAFKDAGTLPGGVGGTYFQDFPVTYGFRAAPTSTASFTVPGSEAVALTRGEDFNPVFGSKANFKANGELIFAGFGVVSGNRDDYRGTSPRGKWVVLFPATIDGGAGSANQAAIAEAKGAVGVIFAGPRGAGGRPLPLPTRETGVSRTTQLVVLAVSPVTFTKLGGLDYELALAQTRSSGKPAAGFRKGVSVTASVALEANAITGRNVIAVLPGNDPDLKSQYVVIGAHLDHLGWGEVGSSTGADRIHNGADDNASGVAMVLALAKHFATTKSNKRTYVFQLYSGEEIGLVGSNYWVKSPTISLASVAWMLNLDMVGNMKGDLLEVYGVGSSPAWKDIAERTRGGLVVKLFDETEPDSDQWSFYAAGIPIVTFFTGYHERYHHESDDAHLLNYAGMEKIAGLAVDYLVAIDGIRSLPSFKRGDRITERQLPAQGSGDNQGRRVRVGLIPDYGGEGSGLLLSGVVEGSPAEKAGLRAGDRIIKWGATTITAIEDIQEIFQSAVAGQAVEVTILRDGKELKVRVVPEAIGLAPAA
jgi:hypothetical protein